MGAGKKASKRSLRTPFGYQVERQVRSLKADAKRKGIAWELTDDEARTLLTSPCHYTGREPRVPDRLHVIDRLDAGVGFTIDNCVPCCWEVARAKHTATEAEFLELVSDIHRHLDLNREAWGGTVHLAP